MTNKKKILIVKTDRDEYLRERENLIKRATAWSDEWIETADEIYFISHVLVPQLFYSKQPLQDFTEIDFRDLIMQYESILATLKAYNAPRFPLFHRFPLFAENEPVASDEPENDTDAPEEAEKTEVAAESSPEDQNSDKQ